MAITMAGVKQLTERANRLEVKQKKDRLSQKATMDQIVGFSSAFVTAAVAGYVDGKYDVSGNDKVSGDGTKVFGVPVVPIAAGLMAVGGIAIGGSIGSAMAYGGLGASCGWSYSAAAAKGREG